jgi:nitrate reductase gamma subunit
VLRPALPDTATIRFGRDRYTWRPGSSQMPRARQLRRGSNLCHVGIIFPFFGHFIGPLTP